MGDGGWISRWLMEGIIKGIYKEWRKERSWASVVCCCV